MKAIARNETLVGVLALICAVAVFLGTAFDANTGLGPAASSAPQKAGGAPALSVRP